ncbi:hypothetical protein BH23GEM6_BH23GEM6_02820 [soil metagenome]
MELHDPLLRESQSGTFRWTVGTVASRSLNKQIRPAALTWSGIGFVGGLLEQRARPFALQVGRQNACLRFRGCTYP